MRVITLWSVLGEIACNGYLRFLLSQYAAENNRHKMAYKNQDLVSMHLGSGRTWWVTIRFCWPQADLGWLGLGAAGAL